MSPLDGSHVFVIVLSVLELIHSSVQSVWVYVHQWEDWVSQAALQTTN